MRIHRVVRERRPYHPAGTSRDVFMVHGASQDFGDIYFHAGTDTPTPQTSALLYLAVNGIDVWEIDLAWTLVPEETTDFSFMQDWSLDRDVDHVLAAMSIARYLRGLTGQGYGRMNLLGFSYSTGLAYVAAGRETQQPWNRRDIGGLVPVDAGLHVDDDDRRQIACQNAARGREQRNKGNFHTDTRRFRTISRLATSAPDEPSPLPPFEGLSNLQAALNLSMAPPFWHFVGVEFNENGIPVDLLYSNPERWINLLGGSPRIPRTCPACRPYRQPKSGVARRRSPWTTT